MFEISTNSLNIGATGLATQSSYAPWSDPGESYNALIGREDGGFSFHTDEENDPWWMLGFKKKLFLMK